MSDDKIDWDFHAEHQAVYFPPVEAREKADVLYLFEHAGGLALDAGCNIGRWKNLIEKLGYADAHVHYIDFTQTATNSTTCPRGYSHNHSLTDGNTNSASHRHNVTGDTGYGGESPPVAGIPGIPLQQMAEVVLD